MPLNLCFIMPMQHTEIFSALKFEIFNEKKKILFLLLLKTLIVDTSKNHRLDEAVLTSTHNLFWIKNKKIRYAPVIPSLSL